MSRKVGIYGGSFDPIHFGHLSLAIEMKEQHQLDEVCFYPSFLNPNKFNSNRSESFASAKDRLQMLDLALEKIPGFTHSSIEYENVGPSYTIDTLHRLIEDLHESTELFLILGEDASQHFFQWNQPEKIIKLVHLLVGTRTQFLDESRFQDNEAVVQAIRQGVTRTRIMEISSTEIRERLAHGLYCGHLLPAKVLDYILTNRLYLEPL
jgi:nicotinate-nucleotide adenylyltransferase